MGRSVDELVDSLTYEEMMGWGEFYQMEPWGDYPRNVRTAHVVATLANIHRDEKKRDKPFGLDDFMLFKPPQFESDEGGMTVAADTLAFLFAKAHQNG